MQIHYKVKSPVNWRTLYCMLLDMCQALSVQVKRESVESFFTELFFTEYYGRYLFFEIQNVHAERQES